MEFDINKFRQSEQETGETIDTFHTRLRKLAETCEFENIDNEIKSQIIQSCSSTRMRRRALRKSEIGLKQLLLLARSFEISDEQAIGIENDAAHVNAMRKTTAWKQNHKPNQPNRRRGNYHRGGYRGNYHRGKHRSNYHRGGHRVNSGKDKEEECRNCGGSYPHQGMCPAKGKRCNSCGNDDHFSRVCRSKSVKQIQMQEPANNETSSSEDEYTFHINRPKVSNIKQPKTKGKICDTEIEILVDTGTTIIIIDVASYSKLRNCPAVNPPITKVFAYGEEKPVNLVGSIYTNILSLSRDTSVMTKVYIVRGNYGSLLSYQTAVDLDIITVIKSITSDQILDEYSDRFENIGQIKDLQRHIHADETCYTATPKHTISYE